MQKMKLAVLVAALMLGATAAHAAGTMTFGLNGDLGMGLGDFSKVPSASSTSTKIEAGQGLGFGGGVYGDYWIKPDYAFGIDVNGEFFSAKKDMKDLLNKSLGTTDAKLTTNVINFGAHGLWAPKMANDNLQPWITYGVGLYRVAGKIEAGGKSQSGNVNKAGFNLGVGADMKAGSSMKVGAHVRYHYVMDGLDPKIVDATTGDKSALNYLTFGLNLTFATNGAK
jgi:opacity protein-like surface antigen